MTVINRSSITAELEWIVIGLCIEADSGLGRTLFSPFIYNKILFCSFETNFIWNWFFPVICWFVLLKRKIDVLTFPAFSFWFLSRLNTAPPQSITMSVASLFGFFKHLVIIVTLWNWSENRLIVSRCEMKCLHPKGKKTKQNMGSASNNFCAIFINASLCLALVSLNRPSFLSQLPKVDQNLKYNVNVAWHTSHIYI